MVRNKLHAKWQAAISQGKKIDLLEDAQDDAGISAIAEIPAMHAGISGQNRPGHRSQNYVRECVPADARTSRDYETLDNDSS